MNTFFSKNLKFLRTKKGVNQSQLADLVGKGYTTISNWENGASWPNFEDLNIIIKYFDVNAHSFLYEDLENVHLNFKTSQFNFDKKSPSICPPNSPSNFFEQGLERSLSESTGPPFQPPKVVTVNNAGTENILLVPLKARAGYLIGYGDQEYIQSLPAYSLPGIKNGTYRMFEVSGYSMHPTFHEKDIVVCQWVENQAHLKNNHVYVVVTKEDGIVIKRLLIPTQGKSTLVLISDNNDEGNQFPPITIEPTDIIEIWEFKALITEYLKPKNDPLKEIQNINYRLTVLENKLLELGKK